MDSIHHLTETLYNSLYSYSLMSSNNTQHQDATEQQCICDKHLWQYHIPNCPKYKTHSCIILIGSEYPKILLVERDNNRLWALRLEGETGIHSEVHINYCPWCGVKL